MDVSAEISMADDARLSTTLVAGDTAMLYITKEGDQAFVNTDVDRVPFEYVYTGVTLVITQEIIDWYKD